jgi:RsmE family RNA methyltransferase
MNLLLIEPEEALDDVVVLRDDRARHLRSVLRVTPGQPLRVGVVDGPLGTAVVCAIDEREVTLQCAFAETPERPRVDLLLAVPRPKVLRRLWAQFAALGVGRILLTNAARVERHYFDTHVLDPRVYRPLLIEGLQQARDTRLPEVTVHRQFRPLVEDQLDRLVGGATRIVADPGATRPVRDALSQAAVQRVLLAIGPEGGWNAFELSLLHAHGFDDVGLGPRTLRSDTACVALLAIVHDVLNGR